MQPPERNFAAEIVRAAFAAVSLPFTLVRRATQPNGEPGQAARLERLNTGKWTRELLKHLEWRRLEELCAAYFEELGFRTGITHDRADGGVDISLYAAGARSAPLPRPFNARGAPPTRAQTRSEACAPPAPATLPPGA